jgi:uncharacterized membrane protein
MITETSRKNSKHSRLASAKLLLDKVMSVGFPVLVLAMVAGYIAYVCYRQYWMLYSLQFPDFDMSNYHQKVWLLSKFKEPFITTRGLNAFGDHASFIDFIFVPIYWIKSSPLVLLWGETTVIGLAGVFVYLIAKLRLQSRFMGAFIAAVFLMYPALHYLNFENYHPVPFAVLFFLMYWYGYQTKKSWLHIISAILLFSVKENMALVLVGAAFYQYAFKRWKPGKWYIVAGLAYTALIMLVIIPYLNGNFIGEHFSRVSSPIPALLRGEITMMQFGVKVHADENVKYLRDLFYPLGLLPLFSPLLILFNSQLWLNLSTSWAYAHRIKYHYTAGIIGVIFVSLIEGIALIVKIGEKCRIKRQFTMVAVMGLLITCMVLTNKIDHKHFIFRNMNNPGPRPDRELVQEIQALKDRFTDTALSVDHLLLPFFADRSVCYKWPNPLQRSSYGTGKKIRIDTYPEYVILLKKRLGSEQKDLLSEHRYKEAFRTSKLLIFKANDAPDMGLSEEFYMGGELSDDKLLSEKLTRSIATGVSNRVIYVDAHIGARPSGLEVLKRGKNKVHKYTTGFMNNRNRLFNSGLLVMQYAINQPEPTEAEYEVLRQYIANGGRILLLCPAWVWTHYDKKPLDRLPYARIARNFGLLVETQYVKPPMKIVHPDFKVSNPEEILNGTFSRTEYQRDSTAVPIVEDKNGNASVVAATRGNARIIVWGQNNLLSKKLEANSGAGEFVAKAVDWLLAGSVEGIQADVE